MDLSIPELPAGSRSDPDAPSGARSCPGELRVSAPTRLVAPGGMEGQSQTRLPDLQGRRARSPDEETPKAGQRLAGGPAGRNGSQREVEHGLPRVITTDNGTEFTSRAVDEWAHRNNVKLDFIHPGKPIENGYIESFNGRLRQECLNQIWFSSLEDAKIKIEAWRTDYNEHRPHTSLGNQTPVQFEAEWQLSRTTKEKLFNFPIGPRMG